MKTTYIDVDKLSSASFHINLNPLPFYLGELGYVLPPPLPTSSLGAAPHQIVDLQRAQCGLLKQRQRHVDSQHQVQQVFTPGRPERQVVTVDEGGSGYTLPIRQQGARQSNELHKIYVRHVCFSIC